MIFTRIRLITKKWTGYITGSILAVVILLLSIFRPDYFDQYKWVFVSVFFGLWLLYSIYSVWLDSYREVETLSSKYNLSKEQEELLKSIKNWIHGISDTNDSLYKAVESDLIYLQNEWYIGRAIFNGHIVAEIAITHSGDKYLLRKL